MDAANYHTFNIQIPVGLHIITPMSTSSSFLDKFSLLLATGLGTLQQSAQRKEIERALSTEPLSEVQPYEFDLALREMAFETAQQITKDFVERLTKKLRPELPASPPIEKAPPVEQEVTPAPPEEETAPQPPIEEAVEQVPEPEPEPIPEPSNPKTQPPSSYTIGQKVENDLLAEVVASVGACENGFAFVKVEGGYQCNGGRGVHFASDAEVEKEYRNRGGK
ncbi:hypothetical protein DL770_007063 [Monosporascus sp. CRB-9-2]|nr:hypothetical protein DL770_007063 [Monosporascus sp. CRB-9-2]